VNEKEAGCFENNPACPMSGREAREYMREKGYSVNDLAGIFGLAVRSINENLSRTPVRIMFKLALISLPKKEK
jgi:hypothetical protein